MPADDAVHALPASAAICGNIILQAFVDPDLVSALSSEHFNPETIRGQSLQTAPERRTHPEHRPR